MLVASLALGAGVAAYADEPSGKPADDGREALYRELTLGLPKEGPRARSARLELDYWHRDTWAFINLPVRKPVRTRDGKAAEVVLLNSPAMSMPGTDFSMAFLLVDKRVVDWASCWTYNRTATQELLLEDVDGDGLPDLSFRAGEGFFGLLDKRQHKRPGDKRVWLYAYAITAKGFESLFPRTDRDLPVTLAYDTAGQPVKLRVDGLPASVRENQMYECTVTVTSIAKDDLAMRPGRWFALRTEGTGWFMTFGPTDERTTLRPGEAVSQTVRLVLRSSNDEVTLRCTFAPD
jgi:hypothetical protein